MIKLLRILLILSPSLILFGGIGWYIVTSLPKKAENAVTGDETSARGRLVVVVVFDQMRGDYLERWSSAFGPDGFEKIKSQGVWYKNAMLPYACSATGPGHASIGSGAFPSVHGIIENEWFDRGRGKFVQSWTDDSRRYERVPPATGDAKAWSPIAPIRILAPCVADALRDKYGTNSRAISISLKGRSAVLMGGKSATAAYCFDDHIGEFHTSSFYRDKLPSWIEQYNNSDAIARWAGKEWDRVKPVSVYDQHAGPDDAPGELPAPDRVFPHKIPKINESYFAALERSPFGNELVWDFTRKCIVEEKLGQREHADLLYVSYSSNDYVGHAFGPDSHEVMDITIRSDAIVGEMIKFLEEKLGRDNYTLIVTADHGVCPTPEVAIKQHPTAIRIGAGDVINGLDAALDETFGPPDGVAGRWVEGDFSKTYPWLYLNSRTVEASGVPADVLQGYIRKWLSNRPDVAAAHIRKEIESGDTPDRLLIKRSFHPERCGDVYVQIKPYVLVSGGFSTGTNHGTLNPYDRHVPVLAMGRGIPRLGANGEAVSSLIVAPLTAQLLGIKPPVEATEPVPKELQVPAAK